MKVERRQESRTQTRRAFSFSWKDAAGFTQAADAQSVNTSSSGLAFRCPAEVPAGVLIYIAANEAFTGGYCLVRHCRSDGDDFVIGAEFDENARNAAASGTGESQNYYEFLQISPAAQPGTIHRVFRYLAGIYHPDNSETGDPERFVLLNRAYHVLSDPERRAAYDAELNRTSAQPSPTFAGIDFMDGVEGELNRRLALLAVLYRKCRSNINDARVTLIELEQQIGFPREYLDFTTWYLRSKKYITKEDNSDFALTASGVDFVEENYAGIPLLRKLLNAGATPQFRTQSTKDSSESSMRFRAPLVLPINKPANSDSNGRAREAGGGYRACPSMPLIEAALGQ